MTNSLDLSDYMDTAQFAEAFRQTYATIHQHIRKGHIRSISVGRTRLIPCSELHDFPRRMLEADVAQTRRGATAIDPQSRSETAYGLRYREGLTYTAIGSKLGVGSARAHQLVGEALTWRRRPRNSAIMLDALPTLSDREFCDIYGEKKRTLAVESDVRALLRRHIAESADPSRGGWRWYHFPPEEQRPEWADSRWGRWRSRRDDYEWDYRDD